MPRRKQNHQWDEQAARDEMVRQIRAYGVTDERVLAAMAAIPRHLFIPETYRQDAQAYADRPCEIGHGQTISQPYIVAYMTEQLAPSPTDRVLEIGTGCGYQTAVLAALAGEVFTLERVAELQRHAREALSMLHGAHIHYRCGNGYQGWPEEAPFDAIIAGCAADRMPRNLVDQLAEGGRMILPLSEDGNQRLTLVRKEDGRTVTKPLVPVRFVPMLRDE